MSIYFYRTVLTISVYTSIGTKAFLHKSFKCDGTSSGYPVFSINTYWNSPVSYRFDWIQIHAEVHVHLCALLELQVNEDQSILMYAGFEAKEEKVAKSTFPVYKLVPGYKPNKSIFVKTVVGTVDGIFEPSFTVPVSGENKSFIEPNTKKMLETGWLIIPLPFLLRDTYTSNSFPVVLERIGIGKHARAFLKGSEEYREKQYLCLIECIKQNGINSSNNQTNAKQTKRKADSDHQIIQHVKKTQR